MFIQGNCVDIMPTLQGQFDCVIADPPYFTGVTSDQKGKVNPWADMVNATYFYKEWMAKAKDKLVEGGSMWIFGNKYSYIPVFKATYEIGLQVNDVIIWDKKMIGPGLKDRLRPRYEMIYLIGMPGCIIQNRSLPNIWEVPTNTLKPSGHKAEKTPKIMEMIITAANCKRILDPFSGSGSAGEAALKHGCTYVGIDESAHWVDYGRKRLHAIAHQLPHDQ